MNQKKPGVQGLQGYIPKREGIQVGFEEWIQEERVIWNITSNTAKLTQGNAEKSELSSNILNN